MALVFDWSGTISDDRELVYRANDAILRAHGHPGLTREELFQAFKPRIVDFYKQFSLEIPVEQLYAELHEQFTILKAGGVHPTMYSDVPGVLAALSVCHAAMGVLSAHPQKDVEREAEKYGIKQYFPVIVGSCLDKSAGLIDLAQRMSTTPGLLTYVGDTEGDMQSALSAGATGIAVVSPNGIQRGYQPREELKALGHFKIIEGLTPLIEQRDFIF